MPEPWVCAFMVGFAVLAYFWLLMLTKLEKANLEQLKLLSRLLDAEITIQQQGDEIEDINRHLVR